MDAKVLQLFRIPETRKKIFVTLGVLLVYRFGFQVPIPGMSPEYLARMAQGAGSAVFGLINAFSGGSIGSTSIFALGIMPYISASIIFSMLSKVSPRIEAVAKEGATGQKKINQWTRLTTVPIALIQSVFVYTGVFLQDPAMVAPSIGSPGPGLFMLVVLSLTGGAILVMWLGEYITEFGIGNGASIMIMAGIVAQLPSSLARLATSDDFFHTILQLIGIWVVTVVAIVYITKGARRIPIQYARLTRGRRVYGGQRHYLPLKVNMAGVMPIIFASVLFVIPSVVFSALGWFELQSIFQDPTGFVYVTLYIALVFGFTFFWNRLMFQGEEIANNLREHGSFVPGIRPGARTAEFLNRTRDLVTMAGAAFLAVIAVVPFFITSGTSLSGALTYFLSGTSVLIVVSVAMDVVDKLNAQLVMRNYEGFMRTAGSPWGRKE